MKTHLRIGEVIAVMLLAACAMPGEGDKGDGGNDEPSLETTTSAITNGDLDAADIVRIVRNAERGHNAPLPMDERADHIVRESRRTGVPVWLILGQANNE